MTIVPSDQCVPFCLFRFTTESFYKALSNPIATPEQVAEHRPAQYLLNYLNDLGARSIIVESEYTDRDYLDDFAAYYVKCFRSYDRRCKRLHFFKIDLTPEAFLAVLSGTTSEEKQKAFREAYLGFVVARPLPNAIIGRTVLSPFRPKGAKREYKCTRDYAANLFGIGLIVKDSLAFQEQDTVLAACGTVSLWSSFHQTAHIFNTPLPTLVSITKSANEIVSDSRPFPSHQLDPPQLIRAIQSVGLEAEVLPINKSVPILSLLYAYLHMKLPVILIVRPGIEERLHAVTVVGYSYREKLVMIEEAVVGKNAVALPVRMKGRHIDTLYVHDDQVGPYAPIKVRREKRDGNYEIVFDSLWDSEHARFYPQYVIVPIYHKIRVTFVKVCEWLARITLAIDQLTRISIKASEWDLFLTTTNEYKGGLRVSNSSTIIDLLLEQQPRFIWRAVLSYKAEEVLEILFDATDLARSSPAFNIIWRKQEHKIYAAKVLDETPEQVFADFLTPPFLRLLRERQNAQQRLSSRSRRYSACQLFVNECSDSIELRSIPFFF